MHCWIRGDISAWVHVFIFTALMLESIVSNTLPLNATIARSNDNTTYTIQSGDKHIGGDTSYTNNTKHTDGNTSYTNETKHTSEETSYTNDTKTWSTNTYKTEIDNSNVSDFNTFINISKDTVTHNTTGGLDQDDTPHPSLNLAIIPAAAVLLFLIVFCIRCCKWFRSYTRGGDKEEVGNQYASIVQIGDDDYGQVDILSDNSTAYNDTVSSYCSFLKRSGNDSTITSIKSFKGDNTRSGTPKGDHLKRILKVPDSVKSERRMGYDIHRKPSRNRMSGSVLSDSVLGEGTRTLSESSEENDHLSTSFSEFGDSGHARRMQRFRVSFVDSKREKCDQRLLPTCQRNINTSTSEFSPRLDEKPLLRSNLKRSQPRTTGQPKYHSACIRPSHSEATTPTEDEVFRVEIKTDVSGNVIENAAGSVKKVSVAVQTDKSFRYTLWKKRRHFSDPGHGEPSVLENTNVLVVKCSYSNKCSINQTHTDILLESCHGNSVDNKCDCDNTVDTKLVDNTSEIDISNNSMCDSGSSDDVFVTCDTPSASCNNCSSDLDKNVDNTVNTETNDVNNMSNNESGDKICSGNNKCVRACTGRCHLSRPLMLKDLNYDNGQEKYKAPICSVCNIDLIVTSDEDVQSHLLGPNCDKLHICDICNDKRNNRIKNGLVIKELDKENIELVKTTDMKRRNEVNVRRKTTSEGDEMTSSLTSLESSGYAEISSESSE